MKINSGAGKSASMVPHEYGVPPITVNAGNNPLNKTRPTKPTMPREKAMGKLWKVSKRKITMAMATTIRGFNLTFLLFHHLGEKMNHLDNALKAKEKSSKGDDVLERVYGDKDTPDYST
jgi:hypothetical protein